MHIKDLCKEAHKIAISKGFWDGERNNKNNTYPEGNIATRNLSELLMLIVSELGEACEALRHNRRQSTGTLIKNKKIYSKAILDENWEKDTFEDEIADVFIRLGDLCQALDIDIEWQIRKKMKYNKTRPRKHGKEF